MTREAKAEPGGALVVDTFGANDVTPLPGGCTCCTVRDELQNALRRLLVERATKPFGRAVIETQQDIGPILRTFVSERALGNDYYIDDAPSLDGNRFVLTDDAPISWDAFSRFTTTLAALRGVDLVHAKGLMDIEGCRGPVAVEFMGHLAARPVELQEWPRGERAARLEFVTRAIEEKTVLGLFNSVRALA